jgi:hypothetical protein
VPVENSTKHNYTVRLVARNEGIEYRDEHDVYRFGGWLEKKRWIVYLPGSKGEYYEPHELTDEEQNTILPRIKAFLEGRKYFGFFGRTYPVVIEREPPVSDRIAAARRFGQEYWQRRKKADQR